MVIIILEIGIKENGKGIIISKDNIIWRRF